VSGIERIPVLVADHDTWTRLNLSNMLDGAGFSVAQASNGVSALRIADIEQPHIILLGHNLPEIGAADVLHSLKRDPRTRHCAVVQLESRERTDGNRLNLDVDGHLTLPCQPIALLAEVMRALEARRHARASVNRRQAEVVVPIRSVSAAARGARSSV
jgi:CheY-like chemotaxis protein